MAMSLRPVYERTLLTVEHSCPQRSKSLRLHVINVCLGHHFRFAASRKWPPAEWPAGPPPTPRAARASRPACAAGRWPRGPGVSGGRWPVGTTCPSSGRAGRSTEGGGFCGKWDNRKPTIRAEKHTEIHHLKTGFLCLPVCLSVCNPPFNRGYGLIDSNISVSVCLSVSVLSLINIWRCRRRR